ncbi:MAG: ATP synthase F1 subunit delta [Xenococcaceae cyanobacterium]
MSATLISSEIAEPYAQALMSVARAQNLTEQFGESFRDVETLLTESSDFSEFITNPVIKDDDKKSVLRRVLGDGANPFLVNFLMLLVEKRRIVFLEAIVKQYLTLLRELNQTVLAEVTSAKELNDGQKQAVIEKVKAIGNANNVELKATIDPELLGGVIIKVGSQVLDASIKGQLRRIRMSLS